MRGMDGHCGSLFSYVDLEARVPKEHPLRTIRTFANGPLSDLHGDFAAMSVRSNVKTHVRSPKYRGLERVRWAFTLAAAAYNRIVDAQTDKPPEQQVELQPLVAQM